MMSTLVTTGLWLFVNGLSSLAKTDCVISTELSVADVEYTSTRSFQMSKGDTTWDVLGLLI